MASGRGEDPGSSEESEAEHSDGAAARAWGRGLGSVIRNEHLLTVPCTFLAFSSLAQIHCVLLGFCSAGLFLQHFLCWLS